MKKSLKEVYLVKESFAHIQLTIALADSMDELQDARDMALMSNDHDMANKIYNMIKELSDMQRKYSKKSEAESEEVEGRDAIERMRHKRNR